MFIDLEDPGSPHSFRSAMFSCLDGVSIRRHYFASWSEVQLLREHRTPKGVPRLNSSRSINIALLRSDDRRCQL